MPDDAQQPLPPGHSVMAQAVIGQAAFLQCPQCETLNSSSHSMCRRCGQPLHEPPAPRTFALTAAPVTLAMNGTPLNGTAPNGTPLVPRPARAAPATSAPVLSSQASQAQQDVDALGFAINGCIVVAVALPLTIMFFLIVAVIGFAMLRGLP
jgi:hypothetical protein